MSQTLQLPDDLAEALTTEAQRRGLTLPAYALNILKASTPPRKRSAKSIKTGAELVAYWEEHGVIGSRPDINDSQAYARKLRKEASQRIRVMP